MIKIFQHTLFIILFICSINVYGTSANDILNEAANKYKSEKSLSAKFTITDSGNSTNGEITTSGDKFHITMPIMTIWYDGHTQWTYAPATNEVNITEPVADELQQVNPFAIISSFREKYNAVLLKSSSKNTHLIKLAPIKSNASNINNVTIELNVKTLFPQKIALTLNNNNVISIDILNVSAGKSLPHITFTFDSKLYPNAEIIDLR